MTDLAVEIRSWQKPALIRLGVCSSEMYPGSLRMELSGFTGAPSVKAQAARSSSGTWSCLETLLKRLA
jgi:hypothetical protein